ncbi:MAG: hypothetical protein LAT63_07655 [Marinobacter sp.]|nr:hypothetical protein [Marinobacter sp.]
MNTQKLINTALNGLDNLGFQLDQYGITSKVNRHNLIALVMLEQKRLEGEWDSLQARIDGQKARIERLANTLESRLRPLLDRAAKLRG